MIGAISNAPIHGSTVHMDTRGPEVRRIMRSIRKNSFRHNVNFPRPALYSEVSRALKFLEPHFLATRCLILWWFTAARPGDVLLLLANNVQYHGQLNTEWSKLAVKFVDGKSVAVRGPYTVHTAIPTVYLLHMMGESIEPLFHHQLRPSVFRATLQALKIVNPRLEARSIRRGALQSLALAGASDNTLMMFSGHKNVEMLHRYLDWGMMRGPARLEGATAAHSAWATPNPPSDGSGSTQC